MLKKESCSKNNGDCKNWGGIRPGAGRPVTGRKKRQYYVTDDEDAQIKQLIDSLRKPSE
ncbi:MAG: hypothetical protein ACM3QW_05715 [Ignavibacteriales bacterium]